MQILKSSADAMIFRCPVCNAPNITRCVQPNGDFVASVVHPERRALVPISHAGYYVEWEDDKGVVRDIGVIKYEWVDD